MDDIKKQVDESWKNSVEKEKLSSKEEDANKSNSIPPEATFSFFISTLAIQASVFLGQIPDPISKQKTKNLPQAKFIIDTLGMLKEKTKNNLNEEEDKILENILYELRMQFLNANKEAK